MMDYIGGATFIALGVLLAHSALAHTPDERVYSLIHVNEVKFIKQDCFYSRGEKKFSLAIGHKAVCPTEVIFK